MWETLNYFAEAAWESVGEGVTEVIDSVVDLEVQKQQEKAKDPEVLKAAEPTKGKRSDGSTIVGAKEPFRGGSDTIMGVDKTTLMIGGGVLLTLIVVAVTAIGRGK